MRENGDLRGFERKFWEKSYDEGINSLDPQMWETAYLDLVRPTFRDCPRRAAFIYMGVSVTFEQLDQYSNRFAHMLLENGFEKGDVVGINLPNIPEYIIAWLGTLKAGCVVSGVSPLLSVDEMAYQLKDSEARGLVTLDAIFSGRLVNIEQDLPDLKLVVAASVGGFLPAIKRMIGKLIGKIPSGKVTTLEGKTVYRFEQVIKTDKFSDSLPAIEISPDDLAYIQYTGGTTGEPKGAMLTHRNVVADLLIWGKWVGGVIEWDKSVSLSGFPFFHTAGLIVNVNCIYMGLTQVLIPNPRDTDHICAEIKKFRPSLLANVPSLYQMLIMNPKFRALDHSSLKLCISGASPFPEESQRELEEIVGQGKLLEVYGMTETSPLTTANPARNEKKLGSIGLPLLNTDIKLIDPESGYEVPIGKAGEICVKGPQVMKGYFKRPEATKESFTADGYLRTGDVAVYDEQGYLTIVDRLKDMILVGGFNVYSKKVEDTLSGHPAVGMVALIGKPDVRRPGSEIVKVFMTINPAYEFDGNEAALKESVIAFAREKLAPYEVPKEVEIREALPLTSVGKIDKKALRARSK